MGLRIALCWSIIVLFQIIKKVKNKVQFILLGTLVTSIVLFATFIYYGTTIKEVSELTMSQAKVENYSISEEISKKLKNFEFGKAKKNLIDHKAFLNNVLGYSELEDSITQSQTYPKYEQLLQVVRDKNKKFRSYIASRSKAIDKQLVDLDQKLKEHISYSQRDSNFLDFSNNQKVSPHYNH